MFCDNSESTGIAVLVGLQKASKTYLEALDWFQKI